MSVLFLSDFLILPGFIDFTSDEVVSIITLPHTEYCALCTLLYPTLCVVKHEQLHLAKG